MLPSGPPAEAVACVICTLLVCGIQVADTLSRYAQGLSVNKNYLLFSKHPETNMY